MNIFVTSEDHKTIALDHPDNLLNKMITETAQLLCTCYRFYNGSPGKIISPKTKKSINNNYVLHDLGENNNLPVIFMSTHLNHPINRWLRESKENYIWTLQLLNSLHEEFLYRRSKHHGSYIKTYDTLLNVPNIKSLGMTPHPFCMFEEFKSENLHESYKNFLNNKFFVWATRTDKRKIFVSWTKRKVPHWAMLFDEYGIQIN